MLSVKARKAADSIFKVFGMTQLRIKSSQPCFTGECSSLSVVLIPIQTRFYYSNWRPQRQWAILKKKQKLYSYAQLHSSVYRAYRQETRSYFAQMSKRRRGVGNIVIDL